MWRSPRDARDSTGWERPPPHHSDSQGYSENTSKTHCVNKPFTGKFRQKRYKAQLGASQVKACSLTHVARLPIVLTYPGMCEYPEVCGAAIYQRSMYNSEQLQRTAATPRKARKGKSGRRLRDPSGQARSIYLGLKAGFSAKDSQHSIGGCN